MTGLITAQYNCINDLVNDLVPDLDDGVVILIAAGWAVVHGHDCPGLCEVNYCGPEVDNKRRLFK